MGYHRPLTRTAILLSHKANTNRKWVSSPSFMAGPRCRSRSSIRYAQVRTRGDVERAGGIFVAVENCVVVNVYMVNNGKSWLINVTCTSLYANLDPISQSNCERGKKPFAWIFFLLTINVNHQLNLQNCPFFFPGFLPFDPDAWPSA